jgi:predicted RNase H-like HicB family nuclease
MYSYPALCTPEGAGFVVTVPEIPEVITEGDSIEEATEYAIDAIELILGKIHAAADRNPSPIEATRAI